jgi:hypothetical protein
MAKKKNPETPGEQSARFVRDAEELISVGKLDPDEGTAGMERLVKKSRNKPRG